MASNQDKLLKDRLLQFECHFTWGLKKSDTDLNDLQNRLENRSELAVKEDRSIGWSFSILAFTKYLQGHLEEARDNLEKAEEHIRKHHGDNCEEQLIVTYGNFAWVYYHMGNYTQSQTYVDKLDEVKKRLPPESPSALHPAIYGEKGITLLRFSGKYYEEATECFKKALEVEPEDINWNAGYAFSLYRIESELTSIEESPAIKQLRCTLELDPDNAHIMVLLGLKYAVYKKFQKAEELVERALELEPENPYVTRYVAKFFRHQRFVDKSISLLNRALEKSPDSAFLHYQMGLSYKRKRVNLRKSGQHVSNRAKVYHLLKLATYHLEKAISMKPSFILATVDLAQCYAEAKNLQKADDMFQKAFDVATAKHESLQKVHVQYADFQFYEKKSHPLAIKHYKEGLILGKDTAEGAKCAHKLKRIADTHISKNPQDGEAFGILGFVHQMSDDKRRAIECYEKAILCDHGNEEYLSALCGLRLSLQ